MPDRTAVSASAKVGGRLLAGAARTVAALRPAAKPLHPRGATWAATLVPVAGPATGVTWLDEPGTDRALVRASRAAGLPDTWPDVHGLAIRVEREDGGVADVLLATTGLGRLGRHVLKAGRNPETMFYGSLLPYRTRLGPVVLGALPRPDRSWHLVWATRGAPWTPFARLRAAQALVDEEVSFDPVLNPPPGLEQYAGWARLRLPAYVAARRSRGERGGAPDGEPGSIPQAVPGTHRA